MFWEEQLWFYHRVILLYHYVFLRTFLRSIGCIETSFKAQIKPYEYLIKRQTPVPTPYGASKCISPQTKLPINRT